MNRGSPSPRSPKRRRVEPANSANSSIVQALLGLGRRQTPPPTPSVDATAQSRGYTLRKTRRPSVLYDRAPSPSPPRASRSPPRRSPQDAEDDEFRLETYGLRVIKGAYPPKGTIDRSNPGNVRVFANQNIPAMTYVETYPGWVYADRRFTELTQTGRRLGKKYTVSTHLSNPDVPEWIQERYVVDPSNASGGVARKFSKYIGPFVNEPSSGQVPNLRWVINFTNDTMEYWSTRDIKKGEELLVCYGSKYARDYHANGSCGQTMPYLYRMPPLVEVPRDYPNDVAGVQKIIDLRKRLERTPWVPDEREKTIKLAMWRLRKTPAGLTPSQFHDRKAKILGVEPTGLPNRKASWFWDHIGVLPLLITTGDTNHCAMYLYLPKDLAITGTALKALAVDKFRRHANEVCVPNTPSRTTANQPDFVELKTFKDPRFVTLDNTEWFNENLTNDIVRLTPDSYLVVQFDIDEDIKSDRFTAWKYGRNGRAERARLVFPQSRNTSFPKGTWEKNLPRNINSDLLHPYVNYYEDDLVTQNGTLNVPFVPRRNVTMKESTARKAAMELLKRLLGSRVTPAPMLSANRVRSPSANRQKTPSPNRQRSPAPAPMLSANRARSPSANRQKTPSPNRIRSPSANRQKTPSPNRIRSPSANRQKTPSPNRIRSPSANRQKTPSPNRTRSPSANRVQSPRARAQSPASNALNRVWATLRAVAAPNAAGTNRPRRSGVPSRQLIDKILAMMNAEQTPDDALDPPARTRSPNQAASPRPSPNRRNNRQSPRRNSIPHLFDGWQDDRYVKLIQLDSGPHPIAIRHIPAKTKLAVYPGFVNTLDGFKFKRDEGMTDCKYAVMIPTFTAKGSIVIDPTDLGQVGSLPPVFDKQVGPHIIGRSNTPSTNCLPVVNLANNSLEIWSSKPIKPGEELSIAFAGARPDSLGCPPPRHRSNAYVFVYPPHVTEPKVLGPTYQEQIKQWKAQAA